MGFNFEFPLYINSFPSFISDHHFKFFSPSKEWINQNQQTDDTQLHNKGNQVLKPEKSVPSQSSQSRKELRVSEILEYYLKNHQFALPRKVLIDSSFRQFMLSHGIRKQAISDLLLSSDVELYITSCNAWALKHNEIQSEQQQEAVVGLALCLTELRCEHENSNLCDTCVLSCLSNENPSCFFVATNSRVMIKNYVELPGVAVITVKHSNLILKEPSATQKKFAEKKSNECTSVPLENKKKKQVAKQRESKNDVTISRKRKVDEIVKEGVWVERKLKQKVQKKDEAKKVLEPLDENRGCKTLFLGTLSSSVKEKDIHDFFITIGRINDVRISQRNDRSAPFAHVEFLTAEAAREAINNLNGEKLHGRRVKLDYAEERLKIRRIAGDVGNMAASGVVGGRRGGGCYGRGSWGRAFGRGHEGRAFGRGHDDTAFGRGRRGGGTAFGRGHDDRAFGRGRRGGDYGRSRSGGGYARGHGGEGYGGSSYGRFC